MLLTLLSQMKTVSQNYHWIINDILPLIKILYRRKFVVPKFLCIFFHIQLRYHSNFALSVYKLDERKYSSVVRFVYVLGSQTISIQTAWPTSNHRNKIITGKPSVRK